MNQDRPDWSLFLASAAHDMKNSIGMLSGTLETLLADDAAKQLPAYTQMAHMLYETRRLNDNLIQLLVLYKGAENAAYPYDPQPLALDQFVEQVIAQNQVLLDSKGIALETEFPPDLIWIFDDHLIIGVIGHALNNAIRYTRDRIRLTVKTAKGMLEIGVEDNGPGYPPAMLDAGLAIKNDVDFGTGSTGLGIYFSSEVARMHKHRGCCGSVDLENGGPLSGGRFILRLP